MKTKIILQAIFLSLFSSLYGQKIKIVEQITKDPIQYATVVFTDSGQALWGQYANIEGEVLIKNSYFDSCEVSCVGFESKTIKKEDITDTIYLNEKVVELKEVIINNKSIVEEIGYINKKSKLTVGVNVFSQAAVYIPNPFNIPVLIHSFSFLTNTINVKYAFRIHLYSYHEGCDFPDIDIISENKVYFLEKTTKGLVEIDIADMNILMPKEGLYAGIECLGIYDENGNFNEIRGEEGFTFAAFQTYEPIYFYYYTHFLKNVGWRNENESLKRDEEYFDRKFPKRFFLAPSFGLKVYKP